MNLKDCYTAFGGDYEEVMTRLRLEKTVTKFLLKFSEDKSFFMFIEAFARKDYDEALRFIHMLKGICQNLSFTGCMNAAVKLQKHVEKEIIKAWKSTFLSFLNCMISK